MCLSVVRTYSTDREGVPHRAEKEYCRESLQKLLLNWNFIVGCDHVIGIAKGGQLF